MEKKKNILVQLSNLGNRQRDSVLQILKRLQGGENLVADDIGLLGFDFHSVDQKTCAQFFNVTRTTINTWIDSGCPRNGDNSYNLFEVHTWLMEREKKKIARDPNNKKEMKLEKEIELLEAKINNANKETMLIKDHESAFSSWANSFKSFWGQAWRKNRHHFVGRSQEEIDVLMAEFGRQLMDVWCGRDKDEV